MDYEQRLRFATAWAEAAYEAALSALRAAPDVGPERAACEDQVLVTGATLRDASEALLHASTPPLTLSGLRAMYELDTARVRGAVNRSDGGHA